MELKQLEYFRVLCEKKNITKAAEALYLSRQSLSLSMKRLEEELDAPLFTRKKEGVSLTEYGEILYACVEEQQKLLTDCRERIKARRAKERENIRIGMRSGLFESEDIQRTFAYERLNPGVALEIVDEGFSDYCGMMQRGELDMAYTVCPPASMQLNWIQLYTSEQCILFSASNRLAEKEFVDFSCDLQDQTILETESRMSQYVELLHRLGIKRKIVAGDRNMLKAMLRLDKGCVITLPNLAFKYQGENICMRPLVNMPEALNLNPCLVYRPGLSPNGRALARYLLKEFYNLDIPLPDEMEGPP